MPATSPQSPAAQNNQPIGSSGRLEATTDPTIAKAACPSTQTASSSEKSASPFTTGPDKPSAR